MTWDEPIVFRDHLDDPTDLIVEAMANLDDGLELDPDQVRLFVSTARLAHRRCLSHWLRENEPAYMTAPDRGPYAEWTRRRRKNPGRFRDGSDLPRQPLAAIYFLCNRFWRRDLGLKFHPDYSPLGWDEDFTLPERVALLNAAASFFLLIAQAVGEFDYDAGEYDYTAERCAKVHATHYRLLDRRRIP